MECRKQLCEKCKKKEDDYFLVTLNYKNIKTFCACKTLNNVMLDAIKL